MIWVSQPIQAGFFFEPVPTAHQQPGHLISVVVALDRHGAPVATESFGRNRSIAPPPDAILEQAKRVATIETAAGAAVLRAAPTRYEGRCAWLEFGHEAFPVLPCLPKGYEHEPALGLTVRSLGGRLILWGRCGYTAVEFLHLDGDVRRVECTNGVVFVELLPADAAGQVRALDRAGRPLPRTEMPLSRLRQTDQSG